MNTWKTWIGLSMVNVMLAVPRVDAADQASATYRVVADVFCSGAPNLAVSSAKAQASLSVGQHAVVGDQAGGPFRAEIGYQATTEGFDSDGDGIPDSIDPDDDNDGIPDWMNARPYDSDNDGRNNVASDDDDDNDTFSDIVEWTRLHTDPCDPSDCLRMMGIIRSGPYVVTSWKSKAGVGGYRLERSLDLRNSTNWVALAGPVAATSSVTSVTDTNAPAHSFYRVVIP